MSPIVESLCQSGAYSFSKERVRAAHFAEGLGLEGDIHAGTTVRHRSRVAKDPTQPNLRQVHLIAAELLEELEAAGYEVGPGRLGENVLTRDLDLLGLPTGTKLTLGPEAVIEVTGLRNPCVQLDDVGAGLMKRLAPRDENGHLVRRAGIMAIVLVSGDVREGDEIKVELPATPHRPLEKV